MHAFAESLSRWLTLIENEDVCQALDWEHLNKRLFNGVVPETVVYRDRDTIVTVLNEIAKSPAYNHMFVAPRGGLDLMTAGMSAEEGCIKLLASRCWHVIKPKALHFNSFSDARWNYFLLETEPQEAKFPNQYLDYDEFVVEDTPGHYVDGTDSCYGVYDYDSGRPLPQGWCGVYRILKGKFLFVMKRGHYNKISATYDALADNHVSSGL